MVTPSLQDYGTLDDASPHPARGEDALDPEHHVPAEHADGAHPEQELPDESQPAQALLASQSSLPTGGPKSRLRWTPKLHQLFVDALRSLGGPHVATPKQVNQYGRRWSRTFKAERLDADSCLRQTMQHFTSLTESATAT